MDSVSMLDVAKDQNLHLKHSKNKQYQLNNSGSPGSASNNNNNNNIYHKKNNSINNKV